MKIIGFDIETVPQENLSQSQIEWLESKLKREETQDEKTRNKIMATTPFLGKIICIGLGEYRNGEIRTISLTGSEKEILEGFWLRLEKLGPATYISFNGLKFDVNFILLRSLHLNIKPKQLAFLNTKKFSKYPHFDVMHWMADWGYPVPNLDIACDIANVHTPKDGEVKASEVYDAYKQGRIKEIAEYCERDVKATLEVYIKLREFIKD